MTPGGAREGMGGIFALGMVMFFPDSLPIIVWVVIVRISVVRSFCEEMANTVLPPVADDGSTKGVRTTFPVMNRRGRSGCAPYQADFAIENPTH